MEKHGLKPPDKAAIAKWRDDCVRRRIDYFFEWLEDTIHDLGYFESTLEEINKEMEAKVYNGKKLDHGRLEILRKECIEKDWRKHKFERERKSGRLNFP